MTKAIYYNQTTCKRNLFLGSHISTSRII